MTRRLAILMLAALPAITLSSSARADDVLHPGATKLDRPTLTALGVQWFVTGDDNHDAKVGVRYRVKGTSGWSTALPLWRVRPEVVTGRTVQPQFAGSIFDLKPATTYEIELHATDADGAVDQTVVVEGMTRDVPRDPLIKTLKQVSTVAALNTALANAVAGDVIELAAGAYAGEFSLQKSGTADNPIVVRGVNADTVLLDGGAAGGNVIEVYGSYVHLERMTLQNDNRAIRFQTAGAIGCVVRRVHIKNVVLGIGSKQDQQDFYIADNVVEGRLSWPSVYADDGGAHANDDGIHVEGDGHVVCHNRLVGFGDAMKTEQDGARAVDFYNNDVLSAYDNDLELDGSEGNTRALRNRFTNGYAPISFQPIFGGPVYAMRNVVVNVAHEQMKFHALGTVPPEEPSGILVYHNTFVSPLNALFLATSDWSHHFVVENNLFFGPASPDNNKTADWTGPIEDGLFDYDGWYPDKEFRFNLAGTLTRFMSFALMQAGGLEQHGVLMTGSPFANGLLPPASYTQTLPAADVALLATASVVDKGIVLPNVNDGYQGAAPDLGAMEVGCAAPIYGPRPDGTDESNEVFGCAAPQPSGPDAGVAVGGDASTAAASDAGAVSAVDGSVPSAADGGGSHVASSGCGCGAATGSTACIALFLLLSLASLKIRRRSA